LNNKDIAPFLAKQGRACPAKLKRSGRVGGWVHFSHNCKTKLFKLILPALRYTEVIMAQEDVFKKLVSHCKEYGYIFQSSEIYDGLSAVYDYGQYGVELKNNIKKYWWDSMVLLHENVVGIDSAIFMHPTIWKASGHVDAFNDPLIDNKDSKKRYRADMLIEDHMAKIEEKINKEIDKAREKFGDAFDEKKFRETNQRVLANQAKIDEINSRYSKAMNANDFKELRQIILDNEIVCPVSGTRNWTEVRQFNLMFTTEIGSTSDGAGKVFLRPETAQGIFVNFLNVQKTGRMKIPFGIAQIGKAFRNEIVARQFIFRMREFEQMEMQYFVPPGTELEWFDYWKNVRIKWFRALGFGNDNYRFHDHTKLAHYANAATDIEYRFPFGFKEVEGIHSRTDFDLRQHQQYSGKKMQYFDPEKGESYIPYVIETSIGLDRTFLHVISAAYLEEELKKEDGISDMRVVLRLPSFLAPVKLAVMPLVRKDGLPEIAEKIVYDLKFDFICQYDDKDSIGRRYRRQDAIGTPYCITIDHQTLEDRSVTVRYRDSMEQERVSIENLKKNIRDKVDMSNVLKRI
jgi:glycyl-tRNA synthetase